MKKTLLTLAFGLLSFGINAQCGFSVNDLGVSTGEGQESGVPVAPTTCATNDGSPNGQLLITQFAVQPVSGLTYNLIISTPTIDSEGNEEGLIVGVSEDGTFDFSNDPATGQKFAADDYSFTSFVYDQAELDVITELAKDNIITAGLGFVGGETLEEVVLLVRSEPAKSLIEVLNEGPLTVEDFLGSILPLKYRYKNKQT